MKLGSMPRPFAHYYGDDKYKKMKEFGFDYADLELTGELEGGTEEEYAAKIFREKELADKAGVKFWQVHGPWRYPVKDYTEEDRANRLETMQRTIRIAAAIGAKYWVIHPIMPFGSDSDPYPEKLWQMNLDFFKKLIPTARENNIVICYENMPMKELSNSVPDAIIRFVDEMNDDHFKFCLDTGHCAVFGISPADAVRKAGERLKVLHIHDNSGSWDAHRIPYLYGSVNWRDFYKALSETGFDGVYSLEVGFPFELSAKAFEYLLLSVRQTIYDLDAEAKKGLVK